MYKIKSKLMLELFTCGIIYIRKSGQSILGGIYMSAEEFQSSLLNELGFIKIKILL